MKHDVRPGSWTVYPCTENVGRHRLGRSWLFIYREPATGFKVNLRGGAFHD